MFRRWWNGVQSAIFWSSKTNKQHQIKNRKNERDYIFRTATNAERKELQPTKTKLRIEAIQLNRYGLTKGSWEGRTRVAWKEMLSWVWPLLLVVESEWERGGYTHDNESLESMEKRNTHVERKVELNVVATSGPWWRVGEKKEDALMTES